MLLSIFLSFVYHHIYISLEVAVTRILVITQPALLQHDEHIKLELDHYLGEPVLPRSPNFDILAWWKANGSKYPTLHAIARDILTILVSTVTFGSTFSTSGRFVSSHRSRLHPKTLEALICAQNWLWVEIKDMLYE